MHRCHRTRICDGAEFPAGVAPTEVRRDLRDWTWLAGSAQEILDRWPAARSGARIRRPALGLGCSQSPAPLGPPSQVFRPAGWRRNLAQCRNETPCMVSQGAHGRFGPSFRLNAGMGWMDGFSRGDQRAVASYLVWELPLCLRGPGACPAGFFIHHENQDLPCLPRSSCSSPPLIFMRIRDTY